MVNTRPPMHSPPPAGAIHVESDCRLARVFGHSRSDFGNAQSRCDRAAIGEGPYLGAFSLASLLVIGWLAIAYNAASVSADNEFFTICIGVRHLAIPVVALAFLLGVQGLIAPNPSAVRQESAAASEGTVRGVLRITRHPFLWGVMIWSAFHLASNGDLASVIFFGTFLLLAFVGTLLMDASAGANGRGVAELFL